MPEAKTIARPYAVAIWRHARDTAKQDIWEQMLSFMAAVVSDDVMSSVVSDPRLDGGTLSRLMLAICAGRLTDTGEAFVKVLAENGKLALIPEIAVLYDELQAEVGGVARATLIAAYPVNARFEEAIASAMRKRLNRDVRFTVEIDKHLLGGVVIRVGDTVIDASVRGQIEAFATALRI